MSDYRAIPRHFSAVPSNVNVDNAELGAKQMGLGLLPQGRQIASLLEAKKDNGRPLYRRVVVQMARRSTKTTAITATLLGRCLNLPGYRIISTAQDGSRATHALKEIVYILDALDPDKTLGLWKTFHSNGGVSIHFTNGSRWECRPPKASVFRGTFADCLLFDEAGEYTPGISEELIQGALPLLDTRPTGQLIITGTPSPTRAGLFWDSLQQAVVGKAGVASLDYGMTDQDDPADESVWWRCHPGLASGLTDIDIVRERFETMPLPRFMTEYLGYFPKAAADRAIEEDAWATAAGELVKPDTERFVLAMACAPDSSSASLVAAWRDAGGTARIALQAHQPGTAWLSRAAHDLLVKYPRARLVYDPIGANLDPAKALERSKVKGRVSPAAKPNVQAGQAALVRMIHAGDLKHADQPGLNEAVEVLQWRDVSESGRWFGYARSKGDIAPISAAALAMFEFENNANKKAIIVKNA